MKLTLTLGYSGARMTRDMDLVREVERLGYDSIWSAGRKAEAEAAVPDALVDEVALCGPRERIRELVGEWRASGVTTLMVAGDRTAARTMADISS
jgi:alkanesulfonate monooxygenase SsuD/methylene tetrahydromethanopterin reductase-like flavin-dependent oxidoreductase (luciferase family)